VGQVSNRDANESIFPTKHWVKDGKDFRRRMWDLRASVKRQD
jgi:hypothetical protein